MADGVAPGRLLDGPDAGSEARAAGVVRSGSGRTLRVPLAPAHPYTGSAIVIWNSGAAYAPPPTNLAPAGPEYGDDSHEFPRAQPGAQQQKATFLLTGKIIDVCAGRPCP